MRIRNKFSNLSDNIKQSSLIDLGSKSSSPIKLLMSFWFVMFFITSSLIDWILILFCNSCSFLRSLFAFSMSAFCLSAFCLRFSATIISSLVVATILLIPNAWDPSDIILNEDISPVFLTWVPPHNS